MHTASYTLRWRQSSPEENSLKKIRQHHHRHARLFHSTCSRQCRAPVCGDATADRNRAPDRLSRSPAVPRCLETCRRSRGAGAACGTYRPGAAGRHRALAGAAGSREVPGSAGCRHPASPLDAPLRAPIHQRRAARDRAGARDAGLVAGRAYLAAYALGRGASGLTFYDNEVTRFFSPHAAGLEPLLVVAVGVPAKR